jgi:glycerol-3-phosphate acyltransferase PlsY
MDFSPYIPWLAAALGGYLLGSIPFGVIAAKLGGLGDIRKVGSGNIGATNVLRTGRKDLALITLLGDGGKGMAALVIARMISHDDAVCAIAGGAAFLGHLFPVWLQFRGGKGVATFFGVLLVADWPAGVLAALTWLAMAALLRLSSLAALTAAALAPFFVLASDGAYPYLLLATFMAVLVFVRHHANIARLLTGKEPRIGAGKAAPPATPETPAA